MEIYSAIPNGIEQGTTSRVTIKGNDFVDGGTLSFSGTGISVESLTFVDENTLEVELSVARDALVGFRDVLLTPVAGPGATLTAGVAVTNFQSLTTQLRLITGERIRPGKSDTDTRFTNDELIDIILHSGGNLYLAASQVWEAKKAEFAELVDIAESGSERKLSQLFKNAKDQSESYAKIGLELANSMIEPVVGESVAWLYPSSSTRVDHSGDPFYDPFLFLYAQRTWVPLAFTANVEGIAMFGTRFQ